MPRPNSYSVSDFKRNLQVAHSFNQGVAYMGALLFRLSSSAMVFWFVPTAANLIGQGEIVWWLYGDIPGIPVDVFLEQIFVRYSRGAQKHLKLLIYMQVGAQTETERKEKKLKVEDALNATKATVDDGIVVGGGCTLLRLASKVDAIKDNLENDEEKFGYNAATGEYKDLMAARIIDPTKVVMLLGTRNFNSKYILDVNCVVVEIIEHEPVPTGNPMDNSRNQDTIARRCRRL
ncbi:hypothetical protein RHGRI_023849 [Rhododendron griersonianum]|uniref:Uncharacterized protein n=1 Tax=Rhododendron griersonianum TaxID=479676 RepID=A0AAV6JAC4_9ERIC|nr:hypothetical protein RHGRI_023849 [Rhododendron griersonianum]